MTDFTLSRRDVFRSAAALALAIPGMSLGACDRRKTESRVTEFTGATMGTRYRVQISDMPEGINRLRLDTDILRILDTVNGDMSTYRRDSELSLFNARQSTDWFSVSTDTLAVIDEALRVSRLCGGAFDVTVGPLVNLWGFGPIERPARFPSEREIRTVLESVGYWNLQTRKSPPAIRKIHPVLYVDLSGIAKGYGVDRLAEHLEACEIHDYLIEIGGDLRVRGRNSQGERWTIGVEKPLPGLTAIQRVIRPRDAVVATSGNYRQYFQRKGRRYSHLIHPQTGEPIADNLASVTIIGRSTMTADAIATMMMVLGPEAGYRLAEQEQFAALFVVTDGQEFAEITTPAFDRYSVGS